ncbi:hypothetical protein RUND412_010078 [Rhizina undulata]
MFGLEIKENSQGGLENNFPAPGIGGPEGARKTDQAQEMVLRYHEGQEEFMIAGANTHSAAQQSAGSHGGGLFGTIGKRMMRRFNGQTKPRLEIERFSQESEPIEATSLIDGMNEVDFEEVVPVHQNWLHQMLCVR